jgi:hypothetical protein
MTNSIRYTATLLLITLMSSLKAQRYDNMYQASDADMLQLQGASSSAHMLKGATLILPNGSNQLNVTLEIPCGVMDKTLTKADQLSRTGYQFHLRINIDPVEIQELLTSTKTFVTQGLLTLNRITKPVMVSYIPVASGTDENGNFNIYMNIQFTAGEFDLDVPGINTRILLKINNAKVNRI